MYAQLKNALFGRFEAADPLFVLLLPSRPLDGLPRLRFNKASLTNTYKEPIYFGHLGGRFVESICRQFLWILREAPVIESEMLHQSNLGHLFHYPQSRINYMSHRGAKTSDLRCRQNCGELLSAN